MKVARKPRLSEAEFLRMVLELARLLGWRVAHFRPGRTLHGWRTPCSADAAGFPDLLLARGPVLLVAELKTSGHVTPEQRAWLEAFRAAGVPAYLWRPRDWASIEDVLRG
jgi:hypothetical protein